MVEVTIEVIPRGSLKADKNFQVEAHTIATLSDPNPDLEFEEIPVYNLVIEHPEGTVLWDTGCHHDAANGHWPQGIYNAYPALDVEEHRLDQDLEKAGYSLNDIDYVYQTHLHMDHAGGLEFFDGTDIPVFIHEREIKFAYFSAKTREGSPGYLLSDFDHDLNWKVIYKDRESHFKDIEFIHLPGHTPGMTGTVITLDGCRTLIFTSDLIDQAINYTKEIPLGAGLLWNRELWFESLRTVKDLERRHNAEVIYGHDPDQIHEIENGWP